MKYRKITLTVLSLCLALIAMFSSSVTGRYRVSAEGTEGCTVSCTENLPEAVSESVNEDGNRVVVFEDGVEVEYLGEDSYLIRDYKHAVNDTVPHARDISDWVKIGMTILSVVRGVLDRCQAVYYVTGHDLCRIVLSYITTPKTDGSYQYEVTGRYISGYIPGCEPAHSLPCNSGYWEYKVVRK